MYRATRGSDFLNLIRTTLKLGKINEGTIKKLTDKQGMELYSTAFTHRSFDVKNNYEVLELMGDSIANTCILNYMFKKFPQLNRPEGVKVFARLKINYVSKTTFSSLAIKLGFWSYISASEEFRKSKKIDLLEDSLEAFIGATQMLLDSKIAFGSSYKICLNIITNLYDDIDISLKYEDLFDAVTRLKELFENKTMNDKGIGEYEFKFIKRNRFMPGEGIIYRLTDKGNEVVGKASSFGKKEARQLASENALCHLKTMGFKNTKNGYDWIHIISRKNQINDEPEPLKQFIKSIIILQDIPVFIQLNYDEMTTLIINELNEEFSKTTIDNMLLRIIYPLSTQIINSPRIIKPSLRLKFIDVLMKEPRINGVKII